MVLVLIGHLYLSGIWQGMYLTIDTKKDMCNAEIEILARNTQTILPYDNQEQNWENFVTKNLSFRE